MQDDGSARSAEPAEEDFPPPGGAAGKARGGRGRALAALGVLGELLITLGLVLGLFVAYSLWWTNVQADRSAAAASDRLRSSWAAGPTPGPGGSGAAPGPGGAAGLVTLWQDEEDGVAVSEIGWMVLPGFQGRGLAKAAVRQVLDAAAADGRWGEVHANPGVTNGPSNGICRALGFRLLGQRDLDFADRILRTNHWVVTPGRHEGAQAGSGTE